MLKLATVGLVLTFGLVTTQAFAANINLAVDNVGANNLTSILPLGDLVLLESCPGGTMLDANGNRVCTAAADKVVANFSDVVEFRTAAGVNNGNTVATLFSDGESVFPALIPQTVYILEDGTLGFGGANSGYTKYVFLNNADGNTYNIFVNSDSPSELAEEPEPSSLLLLGTGASSLLAYHRRKRHGTKRPLTQKS